MPPIYEYSCPQCRSLFERFLPLKNYEQPVECEKCGHSPASRVLSPPLISSDYPGYSCPITGEWVEGKKAHRENLAKHGCRVLEPGEREQVEKRRKNEDAALDAAIEETVGREIEAMPAAKRERLGNELDSGATAVPTAGTASKVAIVPTGA